jgi:hypothetical protein
MLINRTINLVDDAADKANNHKVMVMTVGHDIAKFVKAFPERFLASAK